MRIAYLHQYFVTPEMSGGTRSYEMARRLVADGHEVHMITSDTSGGERRQEVIEGINVTWIPVKYSNTMSFARRIWSFILFAVLAAIVGVKSKPTLVFATSTPLTIVIPALAIRWIRRVPMVFEVRDLWPEMPIAVGALRNPLLIKCARWMEKLAYFQSSMVITLSPGMRDGVVDTGYPDSQVVVIPNGSDIELFDVDAATGREWLLNQQWYRGGPVVLYAGTLGLVNGVGYLVDVARETRDVQPEITFLIIGSGKEKDEIREKAKASGLLGHQVVMLDAVQKREIPTVLSAVSVATSLFRPIPEMEANSANKFFDALASGTPIAINYGGWHERLVMENRCGLRLSVDPAKGAQELIQFLNDEDLLTIASSNAKRLAQSEFSREALYQQFVRTLLMAAK